MIDPLAIPDAYARHLGGLRWSATGDALETAAGQTFAFPRQVADLVEGFAALRLLVPVPYLLTWLRLLGVGPSPGPGGAEPLARAFREHGRPLHRAGLLCGALCHDLPQAAGATASGMEVRARLFLLAAGLESPPSGQAEVPPLDPVELEGLLLRRLAALTPEQLANWFRHGRGLAGQASEQLAEQMLAARPRPLGGVLDELARRDRFRGAAALVAHLAGALALPPRRLADRDRPTGGYADVATRGRPEQILPTQLALEPEEFVRRFASQELLYFRREEPRAPARDELVLLLDQGVRTWGDVRLVLAAAVLALGRLADKRRRPFRVASTGSGGRPLDPTTAEPAALAALLEGSDLGQHPGPALAVLLGEPAGAGRDVVVLTHPRALAEPGCVEAARRAATPARLFALAVDEHGDCCFAELRDGTPVPLQRFHVDLAGRSESLPAAPVPAPAPLGVPAPWTGDVEPVGLPFVRTLPRGGPGLLDFDASGEWVLVAGADGFLLACRADGSGQEALPRGFRQGTCLRRVEAVVGVVGGFVVGGVASGAGPGAPGNFLMAVHYDLGARRARAFPLSTTRTRSGRCWHYVAAQHVLVVLGCEVPAGHAIDLASGASAEIVRGNPLTRDWQSTSHTARVQDSVRTAVRLALPAPWIPVIAASASPPLSPPPGPYLRYEAETGSLWPVGLAGLPARPLQPQDDGLPALQERTVNHACLARGTLAVACSTDMDSCQRLLVLRLADDEILHSCVVTTPPDRPKIALSADGRRLARLVGDGPDDTAVSGRPAVLVTNLGGSKEEIVGRWGPGPIALDVVLAPTWLVLSGGRAGHRLHWGSGRLGWDVREWPPARTSRAGAAAASGPARAGSPHHGLPAWTAYDSDRFVAASVAGGLTAVADRFGQVALCASADGRLIALVQTTGGPDLAVWTTDGALFGSPRVTGGAATPDAAERIGQALLAVGGGAAP